MVIKMGVSSKRLRKTVLDHQYPQLFIELGETCSQEQKPALQYKINGNLISELAVPLLFR